MKKLAQYQDGTTRKLTFMMYTSKDIQKSYACLKLNIRKYRTQQYQCTDTEFNTKMIMKCHRRF